MNIQQAIQNVKNKISSAYDALEERGADMPDIKNLQNLPNTIYSVKGNEKAKLLKTIVQSEAWPSGTTKQVYDFLLSEIQNQQTFHYVTVENTLTGDRFALRKVIWLGVGTVFFDRTYNTTTNIATNYDAHVGLNSIWKIYEIDL